jgi:hypothetical protein
MSPSKPGLSQALHPRVRPPQRRSLVRLRRSLIFVTLCFLCALIIPLSLPQHSSSQTNSPAQQTSTQLINQAKTAYQSQQFEQAARLWQQTADAFAQNGDALNQAMALSNLSLTQQQV